MSSHEQLIPDDLRAALPGLYSTEHDADPLVRMKLFTPWSNWTWYVTEFNGDDVLFGLVDGHEVELGYFTLSELEALEGPGGLRVERDLHFTPRPLSQVRKDVAKRRGDLGVGEALEGQPYEASTPTPELLTAKTGPLARPAIKMIETKLSGAWAAAVSGTIATPGQAAAILHGLIGEADREHFVALYLNNRHQITHAHIVSRGTAQSAPVHPREVFKAAVLANAAAVVVGHNHPSGDVHPSADDRALLDRLKTAGDVLGISVLDALIVGPNRMFHSTSLGYVASLDAGTVTTLRSRDPASNTQSGPKHDLELACRGLLQDIDEVLERQGEAWWDETVTSGAHHRTLAERLLGRAPYGAGPDTPDGPSVS